MPTERVLSTRALNRALLARQLLLERSSAPLATALERVGGLQTQYAPSGYIGLWSRLRDFRRTSLTSALERRRVAQGTLMRSTIHMVSARDYWRFARGVGNARREWWLRVQRREAEGLDVEAVAAAVRRHLANGPLRYADLVRLLAADGLSRVAWAGANLVVDLVRVPPSGTWEQRRADLYGLAEDWLGPSAVPEAEGHEHLVRRYLGGFGPASLDDVADWAGLPISTVRAVAGRLGLRRFRDERGGELFDIPGAALPEPETPAPVRFLPTWDATLLVHARRTQILPEAYRIRVFNTKTPNSFPTFLVDGAVAGTWRYEKGQVRLDSFERLSRATRKELEDEAERLAAFHGD